MKIKQCSTESPLGQRNKEKNKEFLEFNKNEGTMYPTLGDTVKAVRRGKFIVLKAYMKKVEKSHTSDLTEHVKVLKQKEADSLRRSRQQEITKLRAEINN